MYLTRVHFVSFSSLIIGSHFPPNFFSSALITAPVEAILGVFIKVENHFPFSLRSRHFLARCSGLISLTRIPGRVGSRSPILPIQNCFLTLFRSLLREPRDVN